MTATLRVVLDQLAAPTDSNLATATRELTRALIRAAPRGCEVAGIIPAIPQDGRDAVAQALPGLADLHSMALARRELAGTWQLGVAPGVGGGMIHSPSLFAPLVRHDRVHDNDQTVVTVWDLRPWEAPEELPRTTVSWHRAMLKRAAKHADAVVVPTHAMAERLAGLGRLGDRIRVISGAAPADFAVPRDEIGRRRELGLPEGFVLLSGGAAVSDALADGFAAVAAAGLDMPVVVVDAPEGEEPAITEIASAAGIPERLVHVRGALSATDRAAVLGSAVALVASSRRTAFPWRIVEALALGVPVIASDSPVHTDVVLDGGVLAADVTALGEGLARALGSAAEVERMSVLAADRGRAFSWRDAADRVWQLHADL
ncbi:glycosyltransferase [Microbacterium rhizomatis]|uniref:Glycosyltransferase family 4 protein n=1 Tax=Microbacterium rhizomatis TaxID=1631477 RepID=A0A5J5J5D2_9MICO|nr:glycosyltransferase [Microbacterium rhizomatis]KAA9111250.1 glycosyltransferase family 4 protein [Microbacterium rhizomatis]